MAATVKNDEYVYIVSVLRSLLNSRKDQVGTFRDLFRDYKELEGKDLEFRKFGYSNIEEFLRTSDEFLISNFRGETQVRVKASQESQHIAKMIAAQKNTKRGGGGSFNVAPRRLNTNRTDFRQSSSAYTTNYSRMRSTPMKSMEKFRQQAPKRNVTFNMANNSYSNSYNNTTKWQISQTGNNYKSKYVSEDRSNLPTVTYNSGADIRKPLEQSQQMNKTPVTPLVFAPPPAPVVQPAPKPEVPAEPVSKPKILYKRSNSNNATTQKPTESITKVSPIEIDQIQPPPQQLPRFGNLNGRLQQPTMVADQSPAPVKSRLSSRLVRHSSTSTPTKAPSPILTVTINNTEQSHPYQNGNGPLPLKKSSVQQRMQIVASADLSEKTKPIKTEIKSQTPSPTPQLRPTPTYPMQWDVENISCFEKLDRYCTIHNLARPQYRCYRTKNNTYQGKVVLNNTSFSTYPTEFSTESEANLQSAQSAVEQLQREVLRNKYPVIMDSDFDIAIKLLECLKTSVNGKISTHIPELFRQHYQSSLPDNWLSIVQAYPQFFIVEAGSTEGILLIFPQLSLLPSSSPTSSVSTDENTQPAANINVKLELPWNDQHWNLYVTNPVNTDEVWARLIGPEYSDLLSTLITDIEVSMMTDKTRPISISLGDIGLVCVSECWSRVRIDDIRTDAMLCQCFNIDQGDSDWYPIDQIYVCESRFLELPAQAVVFSLFGLEDFAGNPYGKSHLEKQLNFKVLIGDIISTQEEYDVDYYSPHLQPRIKIVIYDTSSDEDVNLNSVILKEVCKDMSENIPMLDCLQTYNRVVATHVDENGDVYCQLEKNGMMPYILKLIHNLVESNFDVDHQHRGLYEQQTTDEGTNQLYLVYDTVDSKWYRASLTSPVKGGTTYNMLFIDYGISRAIDISRIYRLNSLSVALSSFPGQAFKIRLAPIPVLTSSLLERLRGLLPPNRPALVKITGHKEVSLVNMFIQFEPDLVLASVNEALSFENDLEKTAVYVSDVREPVAQYNVSKPASAFSGRNDQSSPVSPAAVSLECEVSSQHGRSSSSPTSMSSPLTNSILQKSDMPRLADFKLPPINELFNVYITIASNPNYFIVQSYDDLPKFNEMMSQLQAYCKSKKEFIPSDMIEVGQAYAGFQTKDNSWYRVTVQAIYGSSLIHVNFCDYGEVSVLDNVQLKILPNNFRILPKLAIKAKLYGIKPKYCDWTMDDAVRFQELICNKKFASILKGLKQDEFDANECIANLNLIDVSGDDDVFLNDILIKENRAIVALEDIATNETA